MRKRFVKMMQSLILGTVCMVTMAMSANAQESGPQNGTYFIMQGDKAVNLYVDDVDDVRNKTTINMYAADQSDTQSFTLQKQSDGSYKILTGNTKYTLNVMALKSGTDVIAYKDTTKNTEYYMIEAVDSGYVIRPKNASKLALTSTDKDELTLAKYTGKESQIFEFKEAETVADGIVKITEDVQSAVESALLSIQESRGYDILLDVERVTTFNKEWKNKRFSGDYTFGEAGCLVCSLTSVINYLDQDSLTPVELSEELTFKNGSLQWGYGEAKRFKTGIAYDLETIVEELEKNHPVPFEDGGPA